MSSWLQRGWVVLSMTVSLGGCVSASGEAQLDGMEQTATKPEGDVRFSLPQSRLAYEDVVDRAQKLAIELRRHREFHGVSAALYDDAEALSGRLTNLAEAEDSAISLALAVEAIERIEKLRPDEDERGAGGFTLLLESVNRGSSAGTSAFATYLVAGGLPPVGRSLAEKVVTEKAEGGETTFKMLLGLSYLKGTFTPTNPRLAVQWLERAAEDGQPECMYLVGALYVSGTDGLVENQPVGRRWLEKAAAAGIAEAATLLKQLAAH